MEDFSLTVNLLSTDGTEESDQVPAPESPATEVVNTIDNIKEEVQEQTPVVEQVEDEVVAIASETDSTLSNSNGQTGITASDEGLSKGIINFILFAIYNKSHFSVSN